MTPLPDFPLTPVSVAHAEVMTELLAACFDDPWSVKDVREILSMAGTFGFIAGEDPEPLGFVLCQAVAGEATILSIGVVPDQRRRGIAAVLLAEVEAGAAEAGAKEVFLEVAEDNPAARRFYEKAGYREVGRRTDYYRKALGGRTDALVLRRAL